MDNSSNRLMHHLLNELQSNIKTDGRKPTDADADKLLLDSILSCYGLENVAYVTTDPASIKSRQPIYRVTYSNDWQEFYQKYGAEKYDPAIINGLKEVMPFEWRSLKICEPEQKEFLNTARDFQLGKNGFSIPIRDRNGARALISMTSRYNDLKWAKYSRSFRSELVNIAYLLHERFSMHSENGCTSLRLGDNLTEREIESLQWTALGKTSEEAALILGVSRRSIDFHVNNAKNKLDTVTRSHAVARALALGLILPVL